jgi:hypothetical protein
LNVGSSARMTGYIFRAQGHLDFAGGAELTGTVFAQNVKLAGGGSAPYNVGLNDCFAANTNGSVFGVTKVRFREVDDQFAH